MKYTDTQLYKDFRADVARRLGEYEQIPDMMKGQGLAALAWADSITELAVANAEGFAQIKKEYP